MIIRARTIREESAIRSFLTYCGFRFSEHLSAHLPCVCFMVHLDG